MLFAKLSAPGHCIYKKHSLKFSVNYNQNRIHQNACSWAELFTVVFVNQNISGSGTWKTKIMSIYSWSRCSMEEKTLLLLLAIEPRFFGYTAPNLVVISAGFLVFCCFFFFLGCLRIYHNKPGDGTVPVTDTPASRALSSYIFKCFKLFGTMWLIYGC